MSGLFLFGAVVGGLFALFAPIIVRRGRTLWLEEQRALPAPGPPPEDRAESVRRVLKHLQRKPIAELEEGSAAVIVGTVKAITGVALLRSPLTGTECLGFHVDVRRALLDDVLRFPQIYETARIVAIEVEDGTGTVRVSADGLELAITNGPISQWEPPHPVSLLPLVPPPFRHHPVTVEEGLLQPGATILVCGVAVRELGATDYRDGASHFVMRATATFPLVASTDPDLVHPGERPIAPEELHRRGAT